MEPDGTLRAATEASFETVVTGSYPLESIEQADPTPDNNFVTVDLQVASG